MRKWLLCGVAVFTVVIVAFLGRTAVNPEDFIGEWYSVDEHQIYLFQDGIIYCDQYGVDLPDGTSISGAYSYCGRSVVLFAMGIEGLENVKELYLVENKDETLLCETEDGIGEIYFVRQR